MAALELPVGAFYAPTAAGASDRWRETNHIRWRGTRITPIGGWQKYDFVSLLSRCRSVYTWLDNDNISYTAYLCERHLYVSANGGPLQNITPVGGLTPPADDTSAGGFGDYTFNLNEYGTPRPPIESERPVTDAYTLGNWGEWLLAMTSSDGRLLFWDPQEFGAVAAAVENAPIANRTFKATPERHVMLFGESGEKRRFSWCDQENITNWNFADIASKAGFYEIEPSAPIVAAANTRDGVLIFTTLKVYITRAIGLPFVYNYEEIANAATPLSPQSVISTAGGAIWPSEGGFWVYDGSSISPLTCEVWSWVQEYIDFKRSRHQSFSVDIAPLSEYWWFFPSTGSGVCNRYVVYNYRDRWWSMGLMERTAGGSSTFSSSPIFVNDQGIYKHESGMAYPGSTLPWAETHVLNVEDGDKESTITQMLPDVKGDPSGLNFTFMMRDKRSGNDERVSLIKKIRPNGYVDIRDTGRDFRMRVQSARSDVEWTIGRSLIDVVARGKR